jgi:hypothetical protein
MNYNQKNKLLRAHFNFNGLKIKLFDEDYQHALENHPGEVTIEQIQSCLESPDMIIESKHAKNACLFYEKKLEDEYFVVVVHIIGQGIGEVRTAYKATYLKRGRVLFVKENK